MKTRMVSDKNIEGHDNWHDGPLVLAKGPRTTLEEAVSMKIIFFDKEATNDGILALGYSILKNISSYRCTE